MADRRIRGAASAGRNQHRQTVSGAILQGLLGGSALIPPRATSASLPTFVPAEGKDGFEDRNHRNNRGHRLLQCCLQEAQFLAFIEPRPRVALELWRPAEENEVLGASRNNAWLC